MSGSIVFIDHNLSSADAQELLHSHGSNNRFQGGTKIMKFIRSLMGGQRSARVIVRNNAALAIGTVTLSSHVATNTVTVNGVTFTCMASGATGNQYNVGTTDALTATNLAAAINASATANVLNTVRAVDLGTGALRIEAMVPGTAGNSVTLAISANGSVSGATLSGGSNGDAEKVYTFGSAAI